MKLEKIITNIHHIEVMNILMPGGESWHEDENIDCLDSCKYYKRCNNKKISPENICSEEWRDAEFTQEVANVIMHQLINFDNYKHKDLPFIQKESEAVKEIMEIIRTEESKFSFNEGEVNTGLHTYRERNSSVIKEIKARALEDKKVTCRGCGINYYKKYNSLSISLIECHHTIPLSSDKHEKETFKKDIILLCANCHKLIHSQEINLDLEKLKKVVRC